MSFGHAGSGNLHMEILGVTGNKKERQKVEGAGEEVVSFALERGGTATGEHGIGIGKKKFMKREHGESLKLMRHWMASWLNWMDWKIGCGLFSETIATPIMDTTRPAPNTIAPSLTGLLFIALINERIMPIASTIRPTVTTQPTVVSSATTLC
jgi:hypothetical protein